MYMYIYIISLFVSFLSSGIQYVPSLSLTYFEAPVAALEGDFSVREGPTFNTDLTLDLFGSRMTVKGGVELSGVRYATDLEMTSPVLNAQVSGTTVVKQNVVSTRMQLAYDYNDLETHRIKVNAKVKDESGRRNARYTIVA